MEDEEALEEAVAVGDMVSFFDGSIGLIEWVVGCFSSSYLVMWMFFDGRQIVMVCMCELERVAGKGGAKQNKQKKWHDLASAVQQRADDFFFLVPCVGIVSVVMDCENVVSLTTVKRLLFNYQPC